MNRFDDKAATWDADPTKIARAEAVARCIEAAVPLAPTTRLLEYGAGTGLVTQALRPAVGPVTLADSSSGMRDVMHAKIAAGQLVDARVWALDLATDPPPDEQFDLIVTVMTLHHIPDLTRVLGAFRRLLPPGGYLCIADLEREDGSFHGADFDGHHGFARDALGQDVTRAGFRDVAFSDCTTMVKDGATYGIFLATARA
ncbi:MAG TPA: class I SAM-dependent methyltransferase [Acidimicrobiales bacterium]|nr:class I SAM-dependent methyltransferase [Acidimicrobiales bacterium]